MSGRLPALVTILAIAFAGCSNAPKPVLPNAVAVKLARVHDAPFGSTQELSGSVVAARTVNIGSVVGGRVIDVDVRVGDRVRAGEPIAEVDGAQYRATYAQAQGDAAVAVANSAVASAGLDAAKTHLQLAAVTAQRMHALYAQGAISLQDEDQAQSNFAAASAAADQAAASVRAAQSAVDAAGAGASAASVPLGETTIRAPFDGLITARLVEPGAVVGPGSQIATLQNEGALELDVTLPDASASSVRAGMAIPVHIDELENGQLQGRVEAVIPSSNPALRSALLKLSLAPLRGLIPGMYGRIQISGNRSVHLAIPTSALVTRAGQSGVFVDREGHANFVPVQAGAIAGATLAVVGNLHNGDVVVASDLERITEGAAVTGRQQ